jgi:hypothetical protein
MGALGDPARRPSRPAPAVPGRYRVVTARPRAVSGRARAGRRARVPRRPPRRAPRAAHQDGARCLDEHGVGGDADAERIEPSSPRSSATVEDRPARARGAGRRRARTVGPGAGPRDARVNLDPGRARPRAWRARRRSAPSDAGAGEQRSPMSSKKDVQLHDLEEQNAEQVKGGVAGSTGTSTGRTTDASLTDTQTISNLGTGTRTSSSQAGTKATLLWFAADARPPSALARGLRTVARALAPRTSRRPPRGPKARVSIDHAPRATVGRRVFRARALRQGKVR